MQRAGSDFEPKQTMGKKAKTIIENKKSKGELKKKPKKDGPPILNAAEAAAIVAKSSTKAKSSVSMKWIEKLRRQRLRVEHPDIAQGKKGVIEEHRIRDEKKGRADTSDSDDSNTMEISSRRGQQLSAVEWAKSLFGSNDQTQKSISNESDKISSALAELRRRPVNLEMVPGVFLEYEPFWRTESLEKIEAAWKIERPGLVESYLSKHKAASRAAKKALTGGSTSVTVK